MNEGFAPIGIILTKDFQEDYAVGFHPCLPNESITEILKHLHDMAVLNENLDGQDSELN